MSENEMIEAPVVETTEAPVEETQTTTQTATKFADLAKEFENIPDYNPPASREEAKPDLTEQVFSKLDRLIDEKLSRISAERPVQEGERDLKQEILEETRRERQQELQNQATVDQIVNESLQEQNQYWQKLDKALNENGIDLSKEPLLNKLLVKEFELQIKDEQKAKGRNFLTKMEMKQITKRHFTEISPILQTYATSPASGGTKAPLGSTGTTAAEAIDNRAGIDRASYEAKKASGNLSPMDAWRALKKAK